MPSVLVTRRLPSAVMARLADAAEVDVWRGEEGKVPGSARQLGIGSVSSIAECLDILETLDRSEGSGVGMIERLKRLLGLKPQAARSKGPIRPAQADVPSRVSGIG